MASVTKMKICILLSIPNIITLMIISIIITRSWRVRRWHTGGCPSARRPCPRRPPPAAPGRRSAPSSTGSPSFCHFYPQKCVKSFGNLVLFLTFIYRTFSGYFPTIWQHCLRHFSQWCQKLTFDMKGQKIQIVQNFEGTTNTNILQNFEGTKNTNSLKLWRENKYK